MEAGDKLKPVWPWGRHRNAKCVSFYRTSSTWTVLSQWVHVHCHPCLIFNLQCFVFWFQCITWNWKNIETTDLQGFILWQQIKITWLNLNFETCNCSWRVLSVHCRCDPEATRCWTLCWSSLASVSSKSWVWLFSEVSWCQCGSSRDSVFN